MFAKPFSCCLFNPSPFVVICYKNTGCTLLHFHCLCSILWDSKTYSKNQFWKTSFTVVQPRFIAKIYYECLAGGKTFAWQMNSR